MGPGKAPVKRLHKSTLKRYTKACNDFDASMFISHEAATWFSKIQKRIILDDRKVEFEELQRDGFPLMDYLGKWTPILSLEELVYPRLVCLFYANFVTLDHPFRIQSKVKDLDIKFDPSIFYIIFGTPINNFEIQIPESESSLLKIPNLELITAVTALTHNPNFQEYMASGKDFDILAHLLHFTICHCFLPKNGSFDHVSCYEFEIMCAL